MWKKICKVSFITWLLASGFQVSVKALPGDTLEQSIQHIQSNDIGRNAVFDTNTIVAYTIRTASLVHKGSELNIWVASPAGTFFQDNTDSLSLRNSSIGAQLSEESYNVRQDDSVAELVKGVWGDAIVQDFQNSQFTDRYRSEYRDNNFIHRNLYRGQRFGYSVSYNAGASKLDVQIYSLQDWTYIRLPNEFEERM